MAGIYESPLSLMISTYYINCLYQNLKSFWILHLNHTISMLSYLCAMKLMQGRDREHVSECNEFQLNSKDERKGRM